MKIFTHVSSDGKLPLIISQNIKKELLFFKNKHVQINIKGIGNNRSTKQNKYYWGVVIDDITLAINEAGGSIRPTMVHELLKNELGIHEMITVGNTQKEVCKSTAEYNPKEFEDYLEKCRAWAVDILNIEINLPKEF